MGCSVRLAAILFAKLQLGHELESGLGSTGLLYDYVWYTFRPCVIQYRPPSSIRSNFKMFPSFSLRAFRSNDRGVLWWRFIWKMKGSLISISNAIPSLLFSYAQQILSKLVRKYYSFSVDYGKQVDTEWYSAETSSVTKKHNLKL